MSGRIPLVDPRPLWGEAGREQREADADIAAAAHDPGFLILTPLPEAVPLGPEVRRDLFRVFSLPPDEERRLWRRAWAPENPNVYRGFFPLPGGIIKQGFDVGPERPAGGAAGDALAEPTPLPAEERLPGWRRSLRRRFAALEDVGRVLMRSLARGLGLAAGHFDAAFRAGNSTFRLIVYPPWPELAARHGWPRRPVEAADGEPAWDIGGEHVDSGFVTLLEQDAVGGLQARARSGAWLDVPPLEQALAVNFGKLLARWTGGRIRATEHRVLGRARPRRSIPFFYEPRIDARIEPLPLPGAERFEPFTYGDHVWEAMSGFAEFTAARRFPSAP